MRLGYHTGYWSAGPPVGAQEAVIAAEQLGYDSVWTAEAYGSDALTPLAWWGSRTSRIRLGTAIAQISARTPTATAMAALTLDHLSGGRFTLGLGVSGPQVVEGWYGQPYPRPLARTREYVAIVRDVLRRENPVTYDGAFYRLPLPAAESSGLGKALRSTVHPLRADLPIHLAAEGPKNVALAAEISDGWLAIFWIIMTPISLVLGWLHSVTYVAALSLWALVSGHWSAWQAARVEVRQDEDANVSDVIEKLDTIEAELGPASPTRTGPGAPQRPEMGPDTPENA